MALDWKKLVDREKDMLGIYTVETLEAEDFDVFHFIYSEDSGRELVSRMRIVDKRGEADKNGMYPSYVLLGDHRVYLKDAASRGWEALYLAYENLRPEYRDEGSVERGGFYTAKAWREEFLECDF